MKKNNKLKLLAGTLFAVTLGFLSTMQAASSTEVLDYLRKPHTVAGQTVQATSAQIAQAERLFASNPITAEQGDKIIANGEAAIAICNAAGTADPSKLSATDKQKILALMNEAGSVIGVSVSFDAGTGTLQFVKDGKVIDAMSLSGKLPFTGTDVTPYVVVSIVAIAAVAVCIADKKGLFQSAK